MNSQDTDGASGFAFISYVREDRERVDRLQIALEQAGIKVWRDTANLWPGQDWKSEIRNAILKGSLAFIACFSENSSLKGVTYQNEELILAAEQMRLRAPGRAWLIPVRFTDCPIPVFDLGAGRTLDSLQRIDLLDGLWDRGIFRLIGAVMHVVNGGVRLMPAVDASGNAGTERLGTHSGASVRNERITSREVQGSPALRRRRLAAELREIRKSKGRTGDAVAASLGWSPSKLGRYERGRTGLQPQEVERLLDYYEITGARRTLLLALAEDAAQKGWWEELDELSADYQQSIGWEHEATSIAIWHVGVVPGLLQTEPYARQIIGSYSYVEPIAPGMVERLVRVRMRRQQVLDREPQPMLSVVLDESVLMRQVGGEPVMYEQLQWLARASDRPNVTLQILPFAAKHAIFGESFCIFCFDSDYEAMPQDVVITEHLQNNYCLEGERETHLHRIAFRTLTNASLDPASSRQLILDRAESHWSGIQSQWP
jgi:transcriptional regulator with XRE-family HTH domain